MQRYTYLRLMDMDHYKKIFTVDFDSELLLKIFQTFQIQVIENESFNNETEQTFIREFLTIISNTPNFSFSMDFLGRKDKDMIKSVLDRLDKLSEEDREVLKVAYFVK